MKKSIPLLRFPEFSDFWNQSSLIEISKLITKGTTPKIFYKQGINYIKLESFETDGINENKFLYIDESAHNKDLKRSQLEESDILFAIAGATIGKCNIVPKNILPANTNQALAIIRLKSLDNVEFTYHVLKSPIMSRYINENIAGGAQPNLNLEQIGAFQFQIPSHSEQQKIATFLSSVDKKIQLLKKQKEYLELYKKGVIQKLFSQELYFKDSQGKRFPNWEKKKFEDLYSFKVTNSLSRDFLNYENGEVKNIHYGDIHTQFKTLFDIKREKVPFINPSVKIDKITNDNYCQIGDLIIADASEDYTDIGKAIEVVQTDNQPLLAGLHTILARPDLSKVEIGFGGYLMGVEYIQMQIRRIAQGTKVLGLSAKKLASIDVFLPCPKEQKKITNCLMSIDTKIEIVKDQISLTEEWKKGLLQQMFV